MHDVIKVNNTSSQVHTQKFFFGGVQNFCSYTQVIVLFVNSNGT